MQEVEYTPAVFGDRWLRLVLPSAMNVYDKQSLTRFICIIDLFSKLAPAFTPTGGKLSVVGDNKLAEVLTSALCDCLPGPGRCVEKG